MRPKWTWKKRVYKESEKVGLNRVGAPCRSEWIVGINRLTLGLG